MSQRTPPSGISDGAGPTVSTRTRPIVVLIALGSLASCSSDPPDEEKLSFVGRDRCISCHVEEVSAFNGSDHDLAMDHATESSVLGDFTGSTYSHSGATWRFLRRNGGFYVELSHPPDAGEAPLSGGGSARPEEYEIAFTFGARPLQQYLVSLPGGRIQRLPVSWDSRLASEGGQRWFHVYGDDPVGEDDVLHWTRTSQNWNRMCASCHSTNLQRGYDVGSNTYNTTWSEIDVSCEACHGPASGHIEWAQERDPNDSSPFGDRRGFPTWMPKETDSEWSRDGTAATARRQAEPSGDIVSLDTCGRCHSHRSPIAKYEPGTSFHDTYRLSLPRAPLYHVDGQVREEVFVLGSFLQSRMYAAGVTCTSCHDPHTTRLVRDGNSLCTGCHSPQIFDDAVHLRHDSDTEAAQCVSCHMPATTFMQVDVRRDHGFRIPRPAREDSPNACLTCHDRETPTWANSRMEEWYGPAEGDADRVADALALAEGGRQGSREAVMALLEDRSSPGILRATAASYLEILGSITPSNSGLTRGARDETVDFARTFDASLRDPDPLVRSASVRSLSGQSPEIRIRLLSPLLRDTVRSVRVEVGRALADVDLPSVSEDDIQALETARQEYVESLRINLDGPGANVEYGDYLLRIGRTSDARVSYGRALEIEPAWVPAYVNLADLLRQEGRDPEGRALLEEGIRRVPDASGLRHALGLLLIRNGSLEASLEPLGLAHELEPQDGDLAITYALALAEVGRIEDAIDVLETFSRRRPEIPDAQLYLIAIYREAGRLEEAVVLARSLSAAHPNDERFRQLQEQLQLESGGGD